MPIWQQAKETAEATKEMQSSTEIAKAGVALASDTAKKQLRAYVCVDSACVKFPEQNVPEAQIHFKNYGQTPAYDFRGWIHTWFAGHPLNEVLPRASDDLSKGKDILGPGRVAIYVAPKKKPLSQEEMVLLSTDRLALYVYGEVHYRDAFGDPQWTKYRYIFGGKGGVRRVPNKEEYFLRPDTEGNDAS